MLFFWKWLFPSKTYVYQPEQWSSKLGQPCRRCNAKVTLGKSISPCNCYLYCHKSCFLLDFKKQLIDQGTTIQCQKCGYQLDCQFQFEYQIDINLSCSNIARLIIEIALIMLLVFGIVLCSQFPTYPVVQILILYALGLLVGVMIYLIGCAIRRILFRKNYKLREIRSTKLEVQTSAFRDLEELSKGQLITGA